MKNIEWFKKTIEPLLSDFEVKYRFYENGDFGDLNQVSFDSSKMSGEVDFWSSGRTAINLWDHIQDESAINLLFDSNESENLDEAFKDLIQKINPKLS